jgi:hypothetical protein
LTNDNLLLPQVLTHRIERGEGKLGRILFTVPHNRAEEIKGGQFTITVQCFDCEDTSCSAMYRPSGVPLIGIRTFPGEKWEKKSLPPTNPPPLPTASTRTTQPGIPSPSVPPGDVTVQNKQANK